MGRPASPTRAGVDSHQRARTVFAYHVKDPERYGVVEFDEQRRAKSIEEKPKAPKMSYAVTGLYFYEQGCARHRCDVAAVCPGRTRDHRHQRHYLKRAALNVSVLGRGIAWLDTGNPTPCSRRRTTWRRSSGARA